MRLERRTDTYNMHNLSATRYRYQALNSHLIETKSAQSHFEDLDSHTNARTASLERVDRQARSRLRRRFDEEEVKDEDDELDKARSKAERQFLVQEARN